MELQNELLPLEQRRIIAVSDQANLSELRRTIDWKHVGRDFARTWLKSAVPFWGIVSLGKMAVKAAKGRFSRHQGLPVYDIAAANTAFSFPPGHPVMNTGYACSGIEPGLYLPIAGFHDYCLRAKYSAFTALCADLGARTVYLEYAEIDGQRLDLDADVPLPAEISTIDLGIRAHSKRSRNSSGRMALSFGPGNQKLTVPASPWIATEPSWSTMIKLRLDNDLECCSAEFHYDDDLGITADLAATLQGAGLKIGGNFQRLHSVRMKYTVEFYPPHEKDSPSREVLPPGPTGDIDKSSASG